MTIFTATNRITNKRKNNELESDNPNFVMGIRWDPNFVMGIR